MSAHRLPVLPDVLRPGLTVVFCGTAAGAQSARAGAYYAGQGNKFWRTLHQIGLTPRQLDPHEFPTLPDYGIGLTDIAKTYSGADSGLRRSHFDAAGLRAKIEHVAPHAFAFNGKRSASAFYGAAQPSPMGSSRSQSALQWCSSCPRRPGLPAVSGTRAIGRRSPTHYAEPTCPLPSPSSC